MIQLQKFNLAAARDGLYSFDPATGNARLTTLEPGVEPGAGCVGFADDRTVGIATRRSMFVAIYVEGDGIAVHVDGRKFSWPGSHCARRQTIFPLVRRFSILDRRDVAVVGLTYLYDDRAGFPGTSATDLFLHIERSTCSSFAVSRFVYLWRAIEAGRKVDEALAREADEYALRLQPPVTR